MSTVELADGAVVASKLADPALFGYISDPNAASTTTVQYGRGVTGVSDPNGDNPYTVTFNRSLVGCVAHANTGLGDPAGSGSSFNDGLVKLNLDVGTDSQVEVTIWSAASSVSSDESFLISAFC